MARTLSQRPGDEPDPQDTPTPGETGTARPDTDPPTTNTPTPDTTDAATTPDQDPEPVPADQAQSLPPAWDPDDIDIPGRPSALKAAEESAVLLGENAQPDPTATSEED